MPHFAERSSDRSVHRDRSGTNATARSFADFPAEKRETVVLEGGLPQFMHPNPQNVEDSDHYKAVLRRRMLIKNEVILFICEFTGTTLFLFFAFGIATQASNRIQAGVAANPDGPPDTSALQFSSLGFGFSLAVLAWVFFRVTGSLFNPALTLGLTLLGNLSWLSCITLSISQYLGAIAAAGLISGLLPGAPNMRATLSGGTTVNQGFWIEFFCTCMLLFTVYMLAGEKHKSTFLAPVGIGLALFLGELLATGYTGGSLNPARALGPDVVARTFDSFAWIYYVAPYAATLFTTAFYKALVWANYQTIVPDQDADEHAANKQVIRDALGGIIGAIDSIPAKDFSFLSADADTVELGHGATQHGGPSRPQQQGRNSWNPGFTKADLSAYGDSYGSRQPYMGQGGGRSDSDETRIGGSSRGGARQGPERSDRF